MNNRSLVFIEKLKAAMKEEPRLEKLQQMDVALEKEAGIAEISKKMKDAAERYAEARQYYGPTSNEAKEKGKELAKLKALLDQEPVVASYTETYREVSGLYLSLNDILFGDINVVPFGGQHD